MTKRVMLDTNYWIELKYDSERLSEFRHLKTKTDIEVLFSYGNFIDLIKADEQDELSGVIASITDTFIPAMVYEGNEYVYTSDPLLLIPNEQDRAVADSHTEDFGTDKTLRFMFRTSDFEVWDDYQDMIQRLQDLYDEYGFEQTLASGFPDYWEQEGDGVILREHEIDIKEYVRKLAELYRVSMMKEEEKIDSNDIADIEICVHAILAGCDILLIESKWKNQGLVEKIQSNLESGEVGVEVVDDFNDFYQALSRD